MLTPVGCCSCLRLLIVQSIVLRCSLLFRVRICVRCVGPLAVQYSMTMMTMVSIFEREAPAYAYSLSY